MITLESGLKKLYLKNRGSNGQTLWYFCYKRQVEEFWVVVIKIQQVDEDGGAGRGTQLRRTAYRGRQTGIKGLNHSGQKSLSKEFTRDSKNFYGHYKIWGIFSLSDRKTPY